MEAAGILFRSPKGKILLCHRTDGMGWAFPGGGRKEDEDIKRTAVREAWEETGYRSGHAGKLLTRRNKDGVDFSTFHYDCDEEFVPKLNHEHDSAVWVTPDAAMQMQLHPGCHIALRALAGPLNEHQLAEAIRDHELVSPQFIENVCLIAMRISGTGFSYRPALKEWVYRRDTIYLTPEFLARCQGLPIIYDHPGSKILTSAEYTKRSVGSMLLPYIEADEVWGVGRVYDKETIKEMLEGELSTSPSVVFRDPKVNYTIQLDNGENLLIEGSPSFIDHLAICKKGVWDKGGEPDGIRVDSESLGNPSEQVITAKMDNLPVPDLPMVGDGETPALDLPLVGAAGKPAEPMQGIPPGMYDFIDGVNAFAERLDRFMARKDLMVR